VPIAFVALAFVLVGRLNGPLQSLLTIPLAHAGDAGDGDGSDGTGGAGAGGVDGNSSGGGSQTGNGTDGTTGTTGTTYTTYYTDDLPGTSSNSSSCNSDGTMNATITWDFSDVPQCDFVQVYLDAVMTQIPSCSGSSASHTFNGLNAATAHNYIIYADSQSDGLMTLRNSQGLIAEGVTMLKNLLGQTVYAEGNGLAEPCTDTGTCPVDTSVTTYSLTGNTGVIEPNPSCTAIPPSSSTGQPNLTAGAITPTTATAGIAQTFTANIQNIDTGSTVTSFPTLFQVATQSNGSDAQDITAVDIPALAGGASEQATDSYTFPTVGTYYMRGMSRRLLKFFERRCPP